MWQMTMGIYNKDKKIFQSSQRLRVLAQGTVMVALIGGMWWEDRRKSKEKAAKETELA
ncbi:hypothetical protein BC829DRAFT_41371 [Chytridium lagenaria]|nr:hypothetical protein BC829DRAFT_41371 [Chytridium lagenaria]